METENLDFNFSQKENYRKGVINSLFYIENFISKGEEKSLINSIYEHDWRNVAGRRLQRWGGEVTPNGLILKDDETIPLFFQSICQRLHKSGIFPENEPNHILVNEYDGDQGIMHHQDGPAYYPRVCIITLEGSSALSFKKTFQSPTEVQNVIVEPRSLLIFEEELYTSYLHGIDNKWDDIVNEQTVNYENERGRIFPRTLRVSLTIRYVKPASMTLI